MPHIFLYGVNKRLHTRQRMRSSNRKAVLWLLKNGYDDIWLKAHGRRLDLIYTTGEWYRALDLWNLFDGICFDDVGRIILIQIKTNSWAKADPIKEFLKNKKNLIVLVINVKGSGKKWEVLTKEYDSHNRKRRKNCSRSIKGNIRRGRRVQNTNTV